MSPLSKEARRKRATEEAAEWAVRIQSGALTSSDRIEFADWLRESPLHVAEMLRISSLEGLLRQHPGWTDLASVRDFPSAEVISLTPSGQAPTASPGQVLPAPLDQALPALPRRRAWQPPRWALVGAVCVVLVVLVAVLINNSSGVISLHTQRGERRELTLVDGSTVSADAETDLRIKLSASLRSVTLLHGSAVFHVAKDRSRPFVVGASGTKITAVGTIFRVANTPDKVVVLVSEGKVTVTPSDRHDRVQTHLAQEPIALTAHQRIAITPTGQITPVEVVTATNEAGPPIPPMVFDSEPVASVISRFNGRNELQIRVADPAVANIPVSGVFNETDPLSFVTLLEKTGQARVVRVSPNEIVLQRADR